MEVTCANCGVRFTKRNCDILRSPSKRFFCTMQCHQISRRLNKPKSQQIEEKRLYDIEYRRRNRAMLKAKKKAYFKRTYDPAKAAVERKLRMPKHIEYCRQPKYKAWKSDYDKRHRAKKNFGPFAEAAMLVVDLNREIKGRMSNAEIKWKNKTSNKAQFRDREDAEKGARYDGRPRNRDRRDRHKAPVSA